MSTNIFNIDNAFALVVIIVTIFNIYLYKLINKPKIIPKPTNPIDIIANNLHNKGTDSNNRGLDAKNY